METKRFVDLWKRGFILVAPDDGAKAAKEGVSVIGTRHLTTLAEFSAKELKDLAAKGEIVLESDPQDLHNQDFPRTLMEYLQRVGDTEHLKNPVDEGLTLIGKECILVETAQGRYEEPMGRILGAKDGSFIIEGEFETLPEGRLLAIEYLDIGKARKEGFGGELKPWRHDFTSEQVTITRVEGGIHLKGAKRLWDVC